MEAAMNTNRTSSPKDFTEADWTNKTILIADDVKINFLLLKAILGKTHANLLWAKDGEKAIEYCRSNTDIDVVLMDYNMPKVNGCQATKQIKQFREDLPIISQTSAAIGSCEFQDLTASCDDFILRPVEKKKLLNKIGKYLNR